MTQFNELRCVRLISVIYETPLKCYFYKEFAYFDHVDVNM